MFKSIANRREAPPNLALEILVNDKADQLRIAHLKMAWLLNSVFVFVFVILRTKVTGTVVTA